MSGITFSSEPAYGKSVSLLVLAPAGVGFSIEDIGNHLYGLNKWTRGAAPSIPGLPADLVSTPGFRLPEEDLDWSEFLHDTYAAVDFVFYYNPFKKQFAEISRNTLSYQKPVYYSYTFLSFHSEAHEPMQKSEPAIPRAALAPASELRPPAPPKPAVAAKPVVKKTPRRRRAATPVHTGSGDPFMNSQLACMEERVLVATIDGMLAAAQGAIDELRTMHDLLSGA